MSIDAEGWDSHILVVYVFVAVYSPLCPCRFPPHPPRHQGEHDGVLRLAEALRGFGPLKPCLIALDDVWAPPTAAALFMPHLNPELHRNLVRTVVSPLPHPLHTRMQPSGVHVV